MDKRNIKLAKYAGFCYGVKRAVETVKKLVTDVMKSDGRVYLDPEPFCRLKNLGASSLDFFAYCWADSEDYWGVYYNILETVYNEFKKNNISVPFNQIEVRNRTDNVVMPFDKAPLPERVEKIRAAEEGFDLETADLTKIFHKKKNAKTKSKKTEK